MACDLRHVGRLVDDFVEHAEAAVEHAETVVDRAEAAVAPRPVD
ncbi:hypothetical protein RM704_21085 [Streptomyces sp. DSM 3412]|uniref:Uncharacterized protein n=1 Tax=Streptomyces gottesmaniae TaxID=3075518 RepID=A0ABU2Z023_9ACTN|nr:hypothetical protein [Streptomyces sp. DSM 3412]MDT0569935.1 hypothetical protein [Streptomyces sp. DSM 3412]